jgi:hypothetical protein
MDFDARVIAYVAAFRIILGHVREVSALFWLGKGDKAACRRPIGGAALSKRWPALTRSGFHTSARQKVPNTIRQRDGKFA